MLVFDFNMDVWEFDKTFEQRLKEYNYIFDGVDQNISIVEISSIWSSYLSGILQQYSWFGVWYLSPEECLEYSFHVPAMVNVSINEINYDELTAIVCIRAIEGNFEKLFSECVEVPLKNLYVTKEQESEELNSEAIANCLDQLRIFYRYLIWPWDEDVEENFSIFLSKFESRLRLYYDIKNGTLNEITTKKLMALISRGKKTYAKMQKLMSDSNYVDSMKLESNESLQISIDLYNNLAVIQHLLSHWSDSKVRKCLNLLTSQQKPDRGRHIILPEFCTIKDTAFLFSQATKMLPQSIHKTTSRCLNDLLITYDSDDTIFVSPGVHRVHNERLDLNVVINGLGKDQKTIITDETSYWYFLKTTGDNVVLRDIVLNLQLSQVALFVSEGVTELNSVLLKVERKAKSAAIVVEYNASLVANRCQFKNFDVAIFCLPGSAVELSDCVFENNETCVEIMPGAQLCMINCDLSSSKNGAVKYNGGFDKNQFKSLESLSKNKKKMLNLIWKCDPSRQTKNCCLVHKHDFDSISFHSVQVQDSARAVLFT